MAIPVAGTTEQPGHLGAGGAGVCNPFSPVPALALPVLTINARIEDLVSGWKMFPGDYYRRGTETVLGKHPATFVPSSRAITSKSFRPGFLIPASAMPRGQPLSAAVVRVVGV